MRALISANVRSLLAVESSVLHLRRRKGWLGSHNVKVGEPICAFTGGVPCHVFRYQHAWDFRIAMFVGDAFVHGYKMYEHIPQEKKDKVEWFTLD